LKPIQIYGRLWFRFYRPQPDLRAAPKMSLPTGNLETPPRRQSSITGPKVFRFLNSEARLEDIGWNGPQKDKLWRYNQHYFDDLNAYDADLRKDLHKELLTNWILENPPGVGVGWEPYPSSLRIVNWIKWSLSSDKLSETLLHSLAVQLRWLSKRLEIHLLGNHLFANAKALFFGGLFFEGNEADRWLKKGLRILNREIEQQILPDGGNFERSTMYHALAFEDVLDLINIARTFSDKLSSEQKLNISFFHRFAKSMHHWLKNMCHPDGEISFFNDAAFDVAPSVAELDSYFQRLEIDSSKPSDKNFIFLKDSGYVKVKNGSALAIMDVAKVGPDFLPCHGHADSLTFELSIGRKRVIVNSGTSCYGSSEERLRQRGTHAHNTVVINGKDSSEVWGGFRVAKRANPFDIKVEEKKDGVRIHGAHDGYKKIFNSHVIHRRIWTLTHNNLA
jgi:uncharacterized heparinase superfamily protein